MVKYKLSRKCKNMTKNMKHRILLQKKKIYKKCNNIKTKIIKKPYVYARETIPQVERNLICYNQSWRCNLCNEMFKCSIIIDHIKPLFLGGCNSLSNYQGLCDVCNKIKTDIIDKKLYKSYSTGEIKEEKLTKKYIITKQKKYFDSKEFDIFL